MKYNPGYILSGVFGLLLLSTAIQAQVSDTTSDFGKEFNAFNRQIQQEFSSFKNKNDSLFLVFLEQSWKKFEGEVAEKPVMPEPPVQPRLVKPVPPAVDKEPDPEPVEPQPDPVPDAVPDSPSINDRSEDELSVPDADKLVDILHLPKLVVPVASLVIGYPDEAPPLTDRLPLNGVLHEEVYSDFSMKEIDDIYGEKESTEFTKELLQINNKETLAQIFTDKRYTKTDNIFFSNKYLEVIKMQGFMNND